MYNYFIFILKELMSPQLSHAAAESFQGLYYTQQNYSILIGREQYKYSAGVPIPRQQCVRTAKRCKFECFDR